ncbi:MAG: putative glycolipid-binding domain-containing protein [Pyrinomonadaceae bacterium]
MTHAARHSHLVLNTTSGLWHCQLPDRSQAAGRYTCLETDAAGDSYRFEQLGSGFTAVLRVDAEGLLEDCPGLFERVWAA